MATTSLGQQDIARVIRLENTQLATGGTTGICKDHRGFIWMGSEYSGLNRFDGNNLESFTENSHGLYSNSIASIRNTPDSLLLIKYYNNIDEVSNIGLFDPMTYQTYTLAEHTQQALPFDPKDRILRLDGNDSESILISDATTIWEYRNKRFVERFHFKQNEEIRMVYKTPNNALWVVSQDALNYKYLLHYVNENGVLLESSSIDQLKSWMTKSKVVFGVGEGEALIFSTGSSIYIKEPLVPVEKKLFDRDYKNFFFNVKLKQFWCFDENTSKKIHVFDIKGNKIQRIPILEGANIIEGASSWSTKTTTEFYWDLTDNFWFKTKTGLAQLQIAPKKFQRFLYVENSTKRAPNPVRGIDVDLDGNLYVNIFDQTYVRKKEDTTFSVFKKYQLNENALSIDDSNGFVWITIRTGTIYKYNTKAQTWIVYPYSPTALKAYPNLVGSVNWSTFKDKTGRRWVGRNSGLSYIDTLTGNLRPFLTDQTFSSVFHFHENKEGLWILTASGVYLMDDTYKIVQHYHKEGIGQEQLAYNNIAHLYEDKDGSFWLASKGGGLIHWNPATGKQVKYEIDIQGSDNIIYAVYPDDFGNLWCSSNHGIICFNKASKGMVFYTEDNGITNNEFNTISHYKDKNGKLYFGSLNGVTAFYPKDLIATATTAPLRLIWVKKYNNRSQQDSIITKEVLATNKISVLPSDREITLHFALLDYDDAKNIGYAYKLEGLDKKWTTLKRAEVNLAGLPYGQYQLLIKAKSAGKNWKEAPLSIEIEVLRPFYLSWWFFLLTISCLVFVVTVFIKLRLRIAQQQQDELQKQVTIKTATIQEQTEALKSLDKMKTRFFVNISHELRTPLTLILGPLADLIEQKKAAAVKPQLELMARNGDRLLNLIEEILDLAKLDAQKIDLKEQSIHLNEFCRWIFSMFESKASLQKIDLKFDYQVEEDFYLMIDKNKTEKILINLLGNALKFTPANGQVLFQVKATKDKIQFLVKNTGVGIAAEDLPFIFDRFYQSGNVEQGGTGVGLALSKEFAKLLQGDLYVNSVVEEGSTFTFVVPKVEGESKELILALQEDGVVTEDFLSTPSIANIPSDLQVLIVEDNQDMQLFIKSLLKDSYQITLANDGQEAQEYLQTSDQLPDLIVSDIMMPRMDGIALLTWLKSEEKLSSIPVIMLTAKAEQEHKLEALTIGVDDYLTKPFVPKELLARIRNLIYQVQSRNELIKEEETSDIPVIIDNLKEKDRTWIKEVEQLAKERVENSDFDARTFAKATNLSLSSLQRRLKRITGLTVTLYIREVRLQKARDILEKGTYETIAEVAYAAGFGSPYYFSKVYEMHFGKKVSDYFKS